MLRAAVRWSTCPPTVTIPDATVTSNARVKLELPGDDADDHLVAYLRVGALEDAEHIGAADDPGQPPVLIHDRQPLDLAGLASVVRCRPRPRPSWWSPPARS
jgi:hypothetical protein